MLIVHRCPILRLTGLLALNVPRVFVANQAILPLYSALSERDQSTQSIALQVSFSRHYSLRNNLSWWQVVEEFCNGLNCVGPMLD